MGEKYRKLSRKELIDINNDLIEVLRRHDDNSWSYIDNHNDATLAKKYDCAPGAIGNIRLELFGKLHKASNNNISESRIDKLESMVHHLVDRLNALCDKLGEKDI